MPASYRKLRTMCGRYAIFRSADEVQRIFGTTNLLVNTAPTWNMAPTREAPVVRRHPTDGARHLDLLRWGLVPHWAGDRKSVRQPINARSEGAATAPMFRDALARRRCIVPIDAFYEWPVGVQGKVPTAVARRDGTAIAAAGLWEGWRGADGTVLRSYVILTTSACPALAGTHERMPVILEEADWPVWLGEAAGDAIGLMVPSAAAFRVWTVSRKVNNVRNDGPDLLEEATP